MEKTNVETREYLDCAVEVTSGVCNKQDCQRKIYLYLIATCLATFFGGLGGPSGTIFSLRCVEPEVKAYSMSLVSVAMKIFGWLPGPILVGKLLDSLCIFKSDNNNCLLYDNDVGRRYYFGTLTGVCVINMTFSLGCYYIFVRRLRSDKPMYGGMKTDEVMG